ncbi:MAG: hypothetical protein AVDCRST_MAG64-4543, partial [uncultured Phycisphaerae bacterium]
GGRLAGTHLLPRPAGGRSGQNRPADQDVDTVDGRHLQSAIGRPAAAAALQSGPM